MIIMMNEKFFELLMENLVEFFIHRVFNIIIRKRSHLILVLC